MVTALVILAWEGAFAPAAPATLPDTEAAPSHSETLAFNTMAGIDDAIALATGADTIAGVSQVLVYGPRGGGCRPARGTKCRPVPPPDPGPAPDPDPNPDPGPAPDPDPVPEPDPDPVPDPDPSPAPGPLPTPSGERFDILLGGTIDGQSVDFWRAPYFRDLPYTNKYDVGWVDGDRVGYSCAYMFLEVDNQIVGRVTFTRPSEASAYAFVNDWYMDEGVRYYDGSSSTAGFRQLNDCPAPTQDYGPPAGPDQRPLIYYTKDGELLENRSYTNTTGTAIQNGSLIFRQLERINQPFTDVGPRGLNPHTVYQRVSVGAYVFTDGEWQLAIVIYYDTLAGSTPITEMIPATADIPTSTAVEASPDSGAEATAEAADAVCRSGRARRGAPQDCSVSRPGR